ncbi:MAG: hypothetical protein WCA99_08595 [Candidatus Sulfotelmatobacter sp.]
MHARGVFLDCIPGDKRSSGVHGERINPIRQANEILGFEIKVVGFGHIHNFGEIRVK